LRSASPNVGDATLELCAPPQTSQRSAAIAVLAVKAKPPSAVASLTKTTWRQYAALASLRDPLKANLARRWRDEWVRYCPRTPKGDGP
jgi:hypothetical protein